MPSGMAAAVRQQVARANKADLVLEKNPYSSTGFTNVIKVRGKYQARLQVKGDGQRKRYQHPLPGLFDTAQEAAEYLAIVKRDFGADGVTPPPRQIEHRKPRTKPLAAEPVATLLPQPVHTPMAVAMARPMPFPMVYVPCVEASPLTVQPAACYTPPMLPVVPLP